MGVDSLNGKQDAPPQRPPALLQSTGINWSWGVWVVVTWVFCFSFFLSFLLKGLRQADMETASHLHRAWQARVSWGHTELPPWQKQEVNCKKLPLFNPGWLFFFFFSLSVIHFGRKPKFNFKQSTKTWKWGTKIRQPNAPGWPHNSCPSFFLIKDVTLTGWLSWLENCLLHQKSRVRFRVKVHT